jgi:hypothetical protein
MKNTLQDRVAVAVFFHKLFEIKTLALTTLKP